MPLICLRILPRVIMRWQVGRAGHPAAARQAAVSPSSMHKEVVKLVLSGINLEITVTATILNLKNVQASLSG